MKLCLGTVQFGMDYGVQGGLRPLEEAVSKMLSLALDKGIDHFDTAPVYGNAEEILGDYRKNNPDNAGKMQIVSKLSSEAFTGKEKSLWADIAVKHAEAGLRRLRISELEAFLFHNAEYIFDENAVQALCTVCQRHMAKKIGVSIYSPQEAMKALDYEEIKVIQIPYNAFDQRLDKCGFFEKAERKGVEVYARSSLLQGLMMMEPERLPNRMQFAKKYLEIFKAVCREYQISPLKAAVGYVARHPGIDYVVFGVDNEMQLSEYLSIQGEGIPEDMVNVLQKEFENAEERLVNPALWEE